MHDLRTRLAEFISHGAHVVNPKRWLAEEAADLATRIPNLDEIPSEAILPLAELVVHGEADAKSLALATDIDEAALDHYLESLCDFGFAERLQNGCKVTPTGERAFAAIAERMVQRELFELKRRLQHAEQLRNQLDGR